MSIVGAVAVPHPPIILPEIGRGEEHKIDATAAAYTQAAQFIRDLGAQTIVLTSPHTVLYADYFHVSPGQAAAGDFSRFGVPGVRVQADYDTQFVNALSSMAEQDGFPAGTLGERDPSLTPDHGTMVPLYFLAKAGITNIKIVRVGLSGLDPSDHYKLGMMIQETANKLDTKTVVLASGDLSHKLKDDGPYGYAKEGPVLDAAIQKIFQSADFLTLMQLAPDLREAAAECGVGSFQIMAGALNHLAVQSELLSYEGPFGVGYAVAIFRVTGEADDRDILREYDTAVREAAEARKAAEDEFVRLARASLESYVKDHTIIKEPADLPAGLADERAGAFVSLKKNGRLRGCIGTIEAVRPNIAQEIIQNAISAGTQDPRFPPVRPEELPDLVYSVDVLGQAEPAEMADLDAEKYGVIVTNGRRRGLLLPNLEGVDTPEQQVSIALEKAGIAPNEPFELERFEVVRHK